MHRMGINHSRASVARSVEFSLGRAYRSDAVAGAEQGSGLMSRRGGAKHQHRTLRLVFAVMVAVSLLFTGAGQAVERTSAQSGAMVGVDYLNIRAEPGTWAEVVAGAGYGQWVNIWDGPNWEGWYYVEFEGVTGWVFGQHLLWGGEVGAAPAATTAPSTSETVTAPQAASTGAPTTPVTPPPGGRYTAWVNTDAVAVRTEPNQYGNMVDTRSWGDQITVIGAAVNGYVPIEHWIGTGWVAAQYLRSDAPPGPTRWIDVDRSSGLVTLYEGDVQVLQVWAAMSWDQSDNGFYATANGTYYVTAKEDDLTWTEYGNAWIRYYVEFDPSRANGFHSYSLEANGEYAVRANAPTAGCVALDLWAAEFLYNFATIGTRVEVHW